MRRCTSPTVQQRVDSRQHSRTLGALVVVMLITSCQSSPPEDAAIPQRRAAVLSEYVPTPAPMGPTKPTGSDCTAHGASECLTGTCLHVGEKPGEGYVCSHSCESASECPPGWTCSSILPPPASAFCFPG